MNTLTAADLTAALALRDLTDPAAGPHALQQAIDKAESALASAWQIPVHRISGPRIVAVADNYDRLRYPPDAITRDRRYSHYLDDTRMLRSHTTAHIPSLLTEVHDEAVLAIAGMCYRRDVIDRHHVGRPHQLDLWRIRPTGPALGEQDLDDMIAAVVGAVLPGQAWYTVPNIHPYTVAGREIYVRDGIIDVEIGECGLAHPELLAAAGHTSGSALAMGLGVDRLTMIVKAVPDIRLLRASDPRISTQMLDLSPYRPVSTRPPIIRDMSLAMPADVDAELLGHQVRELLGDDADAVEEVAVLSQTAYEQLPEPARRRLGIAAGQVNVLVRVVLRHPSRTLTMEHANRLRDRIYVGLHHGSRHEWAAAAPGPWSA